MDARDRGGGSRTGRRPAAPVLLALICLLAGCADEPAPDDSDLLPRRRAVADVDNGFHALRLDPDVEWWPDWDEEAEGRSIRGEAPIFDIERAAAVVQKAKESFAGFEECLKRREFQAPEAYDPESEVPYVIEWREMAYLALCRGRWLFESGREKEALEAALRVIQFGHQIEGAQGVGVVYLVGLAVKSLATDVFVLLLGKSSLGPQQLGPFMEKLGPYARHPDGCRDMLRAEYVSMTRIVQRISRRDSAVISSLGLPDTPLGLLLMERPFLQPNQTRRMFAGELRTLLRSVDQRAAERVEADLQARYGGLGESAESFINGSGKSYVLHVVPVWRKALIESDKAELNIKVAQVLLALRMCQRGQGRLPDLLAELVPRYLEKVPCDPYHGEPLRYSRERRIVYSVGTDGKDSGGSTKEDPKEARWDLTEPTFKIEFSLAEPPKRRL